MDEPRDRKPAEDRGVVKVELVAMRRQIALMHMTIRRLEHWLLEE